MRACLPFLVALFLPVPLAAQPAAPDVDAARTRARYGIRCLERVVADLQGSLRLLREAQQQLAASEPDVRTDAARAVQSLEQRIDDLGEAVRQCLPAESRLAPVVREAPRSGAAARVAVENPATTVVERDSQLAPYVHVVTGERVDGTGSLPAAEVQTMVGRISGRLDRCYGRLVDRGALETGTLVLSFVVAGRGRVSRVLVENASIENATFQRCVREAGRRLLARRAPTGGSVTYAYTLRFGPTP